MRRRCHFASISRLNVGGYGAVVVENASESVFLTNKAWREQRVSVDPTTRCPRTLFRHLGKNFRAAHVHPDGALSIHAEPWEIRRHRRAVMGGAGVYQAGLWAYLAGGQQRRQAAPPFRAALGVNGAQALAQIAQAAHGKVRPSVRWRLPFKRRATAAFDWLYWARWNERAGLGWNLVPSLSSGRPKSRLRRSWARRDRANKVMHRQGGNWCLLFPHHLMDTDPSNPHDDLPWDEVQRASREHALNCLQDDVTPLPADATALQRASRKVGEREAYAAAYYAALSGERRKLPAVLAVIRRIKARRTLAHLLAQLIGQGDRYRAHLARLIRPRRAPYRAPKPLYSRAIPPAAPLAPPALA